MSDTVTLTDLSIASDLPGRSETLRGVVAVPAGSGPWPALVVVHEAFGIDDQMRGHMRHLAELGYLAIMPDLYSDGGARKCLTATFRALRAGTGRAFTDIEAARALIMARDDVTGSVGIIGFCMGGGFALMCATGDYDAASVNYGMLPADLDAALEGACPIVASYGAKDKGFKNAAATLEAGLEKHGIAHDVKEYPEAGHAFLNTAMSGPVLLRPLLRVAGIGPNPEAAVDAWERIDGFFREHLAR